MIKISNPLDLRAKYLLDSVDFPIPQTPVLEAIANLEEYKSKAGQRHGFTQTGVVAYHRILAEADCTTDAKISAYLDRSESAIASYRQRLDKLLDKQARERQEYYAAFDREYQIGQELAAVKQSIIDPNRLKIGTQVLIKTSMVGRPEFIARAEIVGLQHSLIDRSPQPDFKLLEPADGIKAGHHFYGTFANIIEILS